MPQKPLKPPFTFQCSSQLQYRDTCLHNASAFQCMKTRLLSDNREKALCLLSQIEFFLLIKNNVDLSNLKTRFLQQNSLFSHDKNRKQVNRDWAISFILTCYVTQISSLIKKIQRTSFCFFIE